MSEELQTDLETELARMGQDTFREDERNVLLPNLEETQVNISHQVTDIQVCRLQE